MMGPEHKIKITNDALSIALEYFYAKGYQTLDECRTNIDDIFKYVIYPKYDFDKKFADLGYGPDGQKNLGLTNFTTREILLDTTLRHDPRYTFTFAHEIGHVVEDYSIEQNQFFTEQTITKGAHLTDSEEQANVFAAYLLMPPAVVKHIMQSKIQRNSNHYPLYAGAGKYFIHGKQLEISNLREFCWHVAKPCTKYFSNISADSLGIQMFNIGLINNTTTEKIYGYGYIDSPTDTKPRQKNIATFTHIGNINFVIENGNA